MAQLKTPEELRAYFKGDRFASDLGIVIERATPTQTLCRVDLNESHMNAAGRVQGGVIYALADFAFAVASNCETFGAVTLSSTVTYLRPPMGKQLLAEAVLANQSSRFSLYQITVRDELGTNVAQLMTTGYGKG